AFALRPESRIRLERALERARAQFLGGPEPVLTIAIAGGTGAGKSTLINALAGAPIAETSAQRPTTTRIRVYHHQDVDPGALPADLDAHFVAHEREELRQKVLVDTPDLDSFITEHRRITTTLLKRAGLVLYVFSPEKYLEERTWSVLHEERCFSASAAVLNKADRLTAEELGRVTEDLIERFAGVGLPAIRVFRTAANAGLDEASAESYELDDLSAFLEHELQEGDVMRLLRAQRERVLGHLRTEIDRIAPEKTLAVLKRAASELPARQARAGARLGDELATQLAAIELDLAPVATLRQHERFWGPYRTWLTLSDFFRIGIGSLVHRMLGWTPADAGHIGQRLGGRACKTAADDTLRAEARGMQDGFYAEGLPVARWLEITEASEGSSVLDAIANAVRGHFEARAALARQRGSGIIWTASTIGSLVPALLVLGGLYIMGRDLLAGQYVGLPLLGHVLAMTLLFFLVMQALVGLLLPGSRGIGLGIGREAVREVIAQVLAGWLAEYRSDIEADLTELREPLEELEQALSPAPEAEHREAPLSSQLQVAEPPAAPIPERPEPGAETEPSDATAPGERLRRALEGHPSE
ncbi:MAG: GTPase, partial [Planctomycetota bacterium]